LVTIKDIAQAANVSITTASLILNNKEGAIRISEPTKQRVIEAARKLGYVPNLSARQLRNREDHRRLTLALLWPMDTRASTIVRFLNGIQEYIMIEEETEIELLIEPYGEKGIQSVKGLEVPNRFNGAILAHTTKADEQYMDGFSPSVPIVQFHRYSSKYSYVNANNFQAGEKVAEHFIQNRHQQIAILYPEVSSEALELRLAGIIGRLEKAPQTMYIQKTCTFTEYGGYQAVRELIQEGYDPTALICISDHVAMGALSALHDHGVSVPDQCEVMGFDNQEFSKFTIPKLSTVHLPVEKMAKRATQILVQSILDPLSPVTQEVFDLEIIHRSTTKRGNA